MPMFSSHPDLPIGAIARDLERALAAHDYVVDEAERNRLIEQTYIEFDAAWAGRPDYMLWAATLQPYFAADRAGWSRPPTLQVAPTEDWRSYATDCIQSEDPLVVWSAIGLSPEIIIGEIDAGRIAEDSPIWSFTDGLYSRLRENLAPLPRCKASCGIAAFLFLIRRQYLSHRAKHSFGVEQCEGFFRELRHWASLVDETWEPGRKLKMDTVRVERRGDDRLRGAHSADEFSLLAQQLGMLGPIISSAIRHIDARTDALALEAYQYSITAWLTARSRRIDEMQYLGRTLADRSWPASIRRAFEVEFACHLKLANAARDACKYLEGAKHLYHLFRLIPMQCWDLPVVQKELKQRSGVFRALKEAGFEIDPLFAKDDNRIENRRTIMLSALYRDFTWPGLGRSAAQPPDAPVEFPPPAGNELHAARRLRADIQTMPEWKVLMAEIRPRPAEAPARYLGTVMRGLADDEQPASPEVLSAAVAIALRYAHIRSAAKILARGVRGGEFDVTRELLLAFIHKFRRATQLDPFGLRLDRIAEWQTLTRDICAALFLKYGGTWMRGEDRLWIHETIINRTHVHHKSLSSENARRLFEKSTGNLNVGDLREFYDMQYDFSRRTPGAANVETISNCLNALAAESELGRPIAVSLMQMGSAISIIAIGKNIVTDECMVPELAGDLEALADESEHWFKMQQKDPRRHISWPASLRRLAVQVAENAERCDHRARVLLMSMDASLARLPWQHLFSVAVPGKNWLISIVPSLSAFTLRDSKLQVGSKLNLLLSRESGEEISRISEVVIETTHALERGRGGVCVFAGHGSAPEGGGLPVVRLGEGKAISTLDDWLSLVQCRVVVLHCCYSGIPRPLFMEEFGGIVGLAMCLGTRSFLAPVSEVLWSSAATMQREIFRDPGRELGAGYRKAIEADPACSLYTLYGSPFERILPRAGELVAGDQRPAA